jgi:IrrE N-terminal-like domain
MNDRSTSKTTSTVVQDSEAGEEVIPASTGRAERGVLRMDSSSGKWDATRTILKQSDQGSTGARNTPGTDRPDHPRTGRKRSTTNPHLLPSQVQADDRGDTADRRSLRSDSPTTRHQRGTARLMPRRVGRGQPQTGRLVQRMRDLTPPWAISERRAHQITKRQARLLLADAGITAPPVPTEIVSRLDGIHVYPLAEIPVGGLLSASKPSAKGGDILFDSTLPLAEQRITLLHELKHIIDGGHTTPLHRRGRCSGGEQLCTDFALSVLMPSRWLRADWNKGQRNPIELAERYQVPVEAVAQRLHALGLVKHRPKTHHGITCQWQPQAHNNEHLTSR